MVFALIPVKFVRAGAGLTAAFLVSACVAGHPSLPDNPPSAPIRSFNCGKEGRLTIHDKVNAVRVLGPRGTDTLLPASPPGQTGRYGKAPYALVLDEGEALWFVSGKNPLVCAR